MLQQVCLGDRLVELPAVSIPLFDHRLSQLMLGIGSMDRDIRSIAKPNNMGPGQHFRQRLHNRLGGTNVGGVNDNPPVGILG